MAKQRQRVASDLLETLKAEYKESSETWRALEGKAQGTVAIAGVFLAAVFAFVREAGVADGPLAERLGIGASALALVAAVICAVVTLKIRRIPAPPLGLRLQNDFKHLLKVTDPHALRLHLENFVMDQARRWAEVNVEIAATNERKGKLLVSAQLLTAVAAVIVAGLVVVNLF